MELALILAVGGDESHEFRRQSADLDAAWSERGASVQVITRPGPNHITILGDFADRESPLTQATSLRAASVNGRGTRPS